MAVASPGRARVSLRASPSALHREGRGQLGFYDKMCGDLM